MLGMFFGNTEARPMSAGRFPRHLAILAVVALLLLAIGSATFQSVRIPSFGNTINPVVPAFQPVVEPVKPISQSPVISAEWPKVEVNWQEIPPTPGVYLLNPIQGDGFYTGTMNTPNDGFTSSYEGLAYLKMHFPQIEKAVMVAVARDATNKGIVFVSTYNIGGGSKLFLSIDGEKSWHELNLAPVQTLAVGSPAVRVTKTGDSLYLVAQDNTVQEKWWTTTIKMSDLLAH